MKKYGLMYCGNITEFNNSNGENRSEHRAVFSCQKMEEEMNVERKLVAELKVAAYKILSQTIPFPVLGKDTQVCQVCYGRRFARLGDLCQNARPCNLFEFYRISP